MTSSAHHVRNLAIAHIRHHLFGNDRFLQSRMAPKRGPGLLSAAATPRSCVPANVQTRRVDCLRRCDPFKPNAWPYDTALPSGLPEISEGPGRSDNVALLIRREPKPTQTPSSADQVGSKIDISG